MKKNQFKKIAKEKNNKMNKDQIIIKKTHEE